ncbi:redoxin family protein [Butyricimonas sp.]|uniref:TlpA family protein disulfide reductase n=1 Tax=Butyricimonas sp. TaxID=1969738 RepID=UPI0025BCEDD0|nr:redoxin family protein [Butyricimonas sp.]
MRSFVGILFIVLLAACVHNKSVQVSGRVETGMTRDSVISFDVNGTSYEFKLDNKYFFSGKIPLEKGVYARVYRPNSFDVYLSPGEDLEVNIVRNTVSPQFKGTLSAINNYLREQGRTMSYLPYEVYQLGEEEFIQRMQDMLNMNILLLEAKNLGDDFTNKERERIRYKIALQAVGYPSMHQVPDSVKYEPGIAFTDFITGFDFNNEELLSFPFYRQFLLNYFYYYRGKNMSGRRLVNYILNNVTNLKVRDFLLSEVVYVYFAQNGLKDSDYLLSVCWNEVSDTSKLVKVRQLVDRWRKLSAGATAPNILLTDASGKDVQLKDMRGKYLYICVLTPSFGTMGEEKETTVWKELVEEYKEKNIRFLTFATDEEAFSRVKNIPGEHFLLKDPDFYRSYMITNSPRFILINPDGRITDADASKPSGSMKLLLQNIGL